MFSYSQESSKFVVELSNSILSCADDFSRNSTNEFFLVATMGLAGIQWLNIARKTIPRHHPQRFQLITDMVNHSIEKSVTTKQCEIYINILEQTSLGMESDTDMLNHYSMSTGQPTRFLIPPVTTCINNCCSLFGEEKSLVQHHFPVKVTLFDLSGPIPGTKQSLKCKSCGFIYNYTMYGNKQGKGEKYYDKEREFIEVTDSVFCHRNLHNFFCYLR